MLASFLRAVWSTWQRQRVIDISDEYTTWLSYGNAGFLDPGNLYCFDFAMRNLADDSPLLEIGTFCGFSANLLTYYKARYGRSNRLITTDPWRFQEMSEVLRLDLPQPQPLSRESFRQFIKESYRRNVECFSGFDLPYTVELASNDFFVAWRQQQRTTDVLGRSLQLGGPISFVYIDGDHSYKQTYQDFLNCDRHLVPGGFILFDDSADGSDWEVCDVVRQVQRQPNYELVLKNPNYFFMKRR